MLAAQCDDVGTAHSHRTQPQHTSQHTVAAQSVDMDTAHSHSTQSHHTVTAQCDDMGTSLLQDLKKPDIILGTQLTATAK